MQIFVLLLGMVLCAGCGGTIDDADFNSRQQESVEKSAARIPLKIVGVTNDTGNDKYDDLCHYIHIKAAQIFTDSGKYRVVNDELLEQQTIFVEGSLEKPEQLATIHINKILEYNGGTLKVAIFSTQRKRAEVELSLVLETSEPNHYRTSNAQGSSTKGSWGVVMQVNREKMLSGEGFWKLDNSMLGIAAARALKKLAEDS